MTNVFDGMISGQRSSGRIKQVFSVKKASTDWTLNQLMEAFDADETVPGVSKFDEWTLYAARAAILLKAGREYMGRDGCINVININLLRKTGELTEYKDAAATWPLKLNRITDLAGRMRLMAKSYADSGKDMPCNALPATLPHGMA